MIVILPDRFSVAVYFDNVVGVQVLHMDRNDYYGGAAASLNLNQVGDALVACLTEFTVLRVSWIMHFME